MITLNELAYNIKNLAYGGKPGVEGTIDIRLIKHWIHYHRANLIADNINKGILNDSNIYQKSSLYNFVMAPSEDYRLFNSEGVNQFGIQTMRTQNRGDYRNLGKKDVEIPRTLKTTNNNGIKTVHLLRTLRQTSTQWNTDAFVENYGRMKEGVDIYYKSNTQSNYGDFNKFTDRSKPYYTLNDNHFGTGQNSVSSNRTWGDAYVSPALITDSLSFRGLQISPNYIGDMDPGAAGEELQYWHYYFHLTSILENPTMINKKSIIGSGGENNNTGFNGDLPYWDDETSPYPIPRVMQGEMQITLKTIPEIITDGMDDTTKVKLTSGTQVQR